MEAPTKEEALTIARQLFDSGARSPDVVDHLVKMGYDEIEVFTVVREAIHTMGPPGPELSTRAVGLSDIRAGLLILGIGAVVSLLSVMLTDATGRHRYFIAAGAALWGVIYILKGIWRLVRG